MCPYVIILFWLYVYIEGFATVVNAYYYIFVPPTRTQCTACYVRCVWWGLHHPLCVWRWPSGALWRASHRQGEGTASPPSVGRARSLPCCTGCWWTTVTQLRRPAKHAVSRRRRPCSSAGGVSASVRPSGGPSVQQRYDQPPPLYPGRRSVLDCRRKQPTSSACGAARNAPSRRPGRTARLDPVFGAAVDAGIVTWTGWGLPSGVLQELAPLSARVVSELTGASESEGVRRHGTAV